MNQKGETTILAVSALVTLTGLLLLCSLELAKSFKHLRSRTGLFLCAKEAKIELNQFLLHMGRTNWALKNIQKARLIIAFIPGLQGVAMNAEKTKQYLIFYQNIRLALYLGKLKKVALSCRLDPQMFLTPYEIGLSGFSRRTDGSAKKRKDKWKYIYIQRPYSLTLETDSTMQEGLNPKIKYQMFENGAKSFSL